jgi:hypothetical protein
VAAAYIKQLNHNGVFGQGHLPAQERWGGRAKMGPVA